MKQRFLSIFLVAVVGLIGTDLSLQALQETPAQNKDAQKKEEPKEQDAVDIEEAEKQAKKPVPQAGYTQEEYDEYLKISNLPDLKARAAGLSQFMKTRPNSKLNEHALGAYSALLKQLYEQKTWPV